jgi:hypothetical protein
MRNIYKSCTRFWQGYTRIISKLTWRNVYLGTRKSPIWDLLLHRKASKLARIIKDAKPPTDIKTIRSFVGLCNFFWTHIKDFALITTPLFKLTRKDSGYKFGPLPEKALQAFYVLQRQLTSEPVMAFPKADRQYALIMDAATGTAETPGRLGVILTQVNKEGTFMQSLSHPDNSKTTRRITLLSYWRLQLLCGGWTSSMSISRASASSCTWTTSRWKNLVTCTVRC